MITTLGYHGNATLPQRLSRDEPSTVAAVARTGTLVRDDDYAAVGGSAAALVREKDAVRSTIGVPVFLGGSLWGAITAGAAAPVGFPAATDQALIRLAEVISSSLANAQAQERLRFRARFDPGTSRRSARNKGSRPASSASHRPIEPCIAGISWAAPWRSTMRSTHCSSAAREPSRTPRKRLVETRGRLLAAQRDAKRSEPTTEPRRPLVLVRRDTLVSAA